MAAQRVVALDLGLTEAVSLAISVSAEADADLGLTDAISVGAPVGDPLRPILSVPSFGLLLR